MSHPPGENTESLLEDGDEDALARVFSQHKDRLWRMVEFRMDKRLSGRLSADDILQEGYLAAAQRIAHFKQTEMSPFVWLRSIMLQTLIDLTRQHLSAKKRSVNREQRARSMTTSMCLAARIASSDTSPSQTIAKAEVIQRIASAINGMSELDQEVLALRHFEQLSNREVADSLGIEQKTASIRYARALKRLKEILSSTPGFTEEFQRVDS